MSRLLLLSLFAAAALAVGGCGTSTHRLVPATEPSGPAVPGAPAVANPTDLASKPRISAGQPPKPTQLVKKDLVVGTGTAAVASSTVSVRYVGANYDDGKEFDSSWSRGAQPTAFPLNGVIAGFAHGIVGMKIGGRRELVIPPAMGYGAQGSAPAVGPDETLVFVIDLVAVS